MTLKKFLQWIEKNRAVKGRTQIIQHAANELKVSTTTIREWEKNGVFPIQYQALAHVRSNYEVKL